MSIQGLMITRKERSTDVINLLLLRQRLEVLGQVALALHDLFLRRDLLLVDLSLQLRNGLRQVVRPAHHLLKHTTYRA